MNDRLRIAAMNVTAMLANDKWQTWAPILISRNAVVMADAALAAAGEQDDPALHKDCISPAFHRAVVDRLQVVVSMKELDDLRNEIARLKRLLEPLTEEELDAVIPDMRRCDGMKYGQMALYLDGVFSTVKNRRA